MWFKHKKWKENKVSYNKIHMGFGGFWAAGWLFTVGLLKLTFWKAVLAIVIWAYYLGVAAAHIWGI